MRILWVKAGKLLPVDTGGKIRSFNLLRQLASGHDVTLLSYYGGRRDQQYETALRDTFSKAVPVHTGAWDGSTAARVLDYARRSLSPAPYAVAKFADDSVKRMIAGWDASAAFDVSVCDFLSASLNFPDERRIPTVLFQHNVESILWRRQADTERHPVRRRIFAREADKMTRYERRTVGAFEHIIAVSDTDRRTMLEMAPDARISVVPTGVDTAAFRPASRERPRAPIVLFLGSMDWEPNIDGVRYFVSEVWPRVVDAVPAARFHIVGRNPPPAIRALASSQVEVTGRVPSVQEHLSRAAAVVVPLRIGGGTRLKIYEAMAAAKAVVSTSIGAEGLDVTDGRDIILADTPETFAGGVVRLLSDAAVRARFEDAALAVASRYDWSCVGESFAKVLEQASLSAAGRRTQAVA